MSRLGLGEVVSYTNENQAAEAFLLTTGPEVTPFSKK